MVAPRILSHDFDGWTVILALYLEQMCVCLVLKLFASATSIWTWFVITILFRLRCIRFMFELYVICNGSANLLWSWLDVEKFEIVRDFTDYQDYEGISTRIWLLRWLFLYLHFYNLVSSIIVGIGPCLAVTIHMCIWNKRVFGFTKTIANLYLYIHVCDLYFEN
jgi:hypothetical protein